LQNIKIKICGIKDPKTLDCCNENNVDFYGLIFYKKSKRNISIENSLKLVNLSYKKKINPVGVFVNQNINDLKIILKELKLNYIQLHGKENNDYILNIKRELDIKIIKAISVKEKKDIEDINKYPDADYLLFDYKPNKTEQPGGNAKSFDWNILKNLKIDKPWFISGGINKDNISYILNNLNPYGIDISSGVEDIPGIKSNEKIIDIMRLLNEK